MQRFARSGSGVLLLINLLVAGCSGSASASPSAPAATAAPASAGPSAPAASVAASGDPKDPVTLSWDAVVAQAKAEGQLSFYAWWGEDFWKEAAKEFTAKYGIKVNVIIGDGTIDKMLAEKDKSEGTVDVDLIGGNDVKTAMDAGIWYGPIFPNMPSSKELVQGLAQYQEGVETKGYLVPIYRNQTGFVYDPSRVANPPQTWDEFVSWIAANPKGFAYCDPNKGGSGQAFVQAVISNLTGGIDKYKGDTSVDQSKVANWNLAWDWLKANNPKMNVTLSNSESLDLLNQGAASMAILWDDDTLAAVSKGTIFKGAKMYIPSFGLPGGGDTAGIPKNAPHKAAGMLFLDFLTSKDTQELMNKTVGSTPARTDITDLPTVLPEDQRTKATTWVPAPYKDLLKKDFTKNVLLQ
jgi:putative spermidine/putrescine transport system substrate-binding protein